MSPDWRDWVDPERKQLLKHSVITSIYLIVNQTDNLSDPQFAGMKPLYDVCIVSQNICFPALRS